MSRHGRYGAILVPMLAMHCLWAGQTVAAGLADQPVVPGGPRPAAIAAEIEGLGPAIAASELAVTRARGTDETTPETAPAVTEPSVNGATLTGNTIGSAETGVATIRDSINNNTGFTTVFQNTGNNVLFQSSTVVNITVR